MDAGPLAMVPAQNPRETKPLEGTCWKTSFRLYAVPLLIVIVALIHTHQWKTQQRSSWGSGCAFGMFSTVDYHGTRWVRAYQVINGQREELTLDPRQFEDEIFRVRVLPSQRNLADLATEIRRASSISNASTVNSAEDLELEVWGIQLHANRRLILGHLVGEYQEYMNTTRFVSSEANHD